MTVTSHTTHHESTAIFRHLLDALARPGTLHQLPETGITQTLPETLNPYALDALATLLDRETTAAVCIAGEWLNADDAQFTALRRMLPAIMVEPALADFALIGGGAVRLSDLPQGTLSEPERGATAFLCVRSIMASAISDHDDALVLDLRGPGIKDVATVIVAGLGDEVLAQIIQTRREYPQGVDVLCIARDGQCLGLPRSTRLSRRG